MRRSITLLVKSSFVFFLLCSNALFAQQRPQIKIFNASNGMLENSIYNVTTDELGYLWVAGRTNLYRYDGNNFKKILLNPAKAETDFANYVVAMSSILPEKKILIRTRDGRIYTIKNGMPELYNETILDSSYIYPLVGRFPSEQLFNQFNLPLQALKGKLGWNKEVKEIMPLTATDFLVVGGLRDLLFYYSNGRLKKSLRLKKPVRMFLKSGPHCLIYDWKNDLYLYDSTREEFKQLSFEKDLSAAQMLPAFFWDISNDESYCYYNSVFYQLKVDGQERKVKLVPRFKMEQKGTSWTNVFYDPASTTFFLSSRTEGLFQVKEKRIQTLSPEESSNTSTKEELIKYTALKTSDSSVVTATGLEFVNRQGTITVKRKGQFSGNRETIARLADGTLLSVYRNQIANFSPSGNFMKRGLFNKDFEAGDITLLQPEGDSLWVCSNKGIYSVTPQTARLIYDEKQWNPGLSDIKLFFRLSATEVLISNTKGLFKISTTAPYAMESFPEMKNKQVRCVTRYKDLFIICAYQHGLYILKDQRFYKVPGEEDRPQLKTAHSTYIDKNGSVWMPTDNGLLRTSVESLVEATFDKNKKPFYFLYSVADGLVNVEFNGAGTPPYAALPDGQLFYPSMGGIVTFNINELHDNILAQPPLIDKITIDNIASNHSRRDTVQLPANYKLFTIDFSVPWFGERENLLLEYKLDNGNWEKIPVKSEQRLLLLEDLSSGYHTLQVRKRTGFGHTDFAYKTIILYKAKHIYENWWFYVAIILLVILLVWAVVRLQTAGINRKRKALQKLVDEQTSELSKTVEIRELLINIISHDMSTPLRHIGIIAGLLAKQLSNDKEKQNALLDIEGTSKKILAGSFDIINLMKYNQEKILVNKQSVNLASLVKETVAIYDPVARGKELVIKNETDESIIVKVDASIFNTILNNILSNAVKYTKSGSIAITASKDEERKTVELQVKDTGRGISQEGLWVINEVLQGNIKAIKTSSRLSTGLGYIIISELLRIHQLQLTVESKVDEGTTVTLVIPVPEELQ